VDEVISLGEAVAQEYYKQAFVVDRAAATPM
jgi:hypothetical protein